MQLYEDELAEEVGTVSRTQGGGVMRVVGGWWDEVSK